MHVKHKHNQTSISEEQRIGGLEYILSSVVIKHKLPFRCCCWIGLVFFLLLVQRLAYLFNHLIQTQTRYHFAAHLFHFSLKNFSWCGRGAWKKIEYKM
jgi:hypothetical protein